MMNRYKTAADVFNSGILSRLTPPKPKGSDRVLRSTKLEDAIYGDLRSAPDDPLAQIEADGVERLSTFKGLSRDTFQAVYSLNPRRNEEADLSTMARKFNKHILDDMMNGDEYPTLKSLCEGRELPAFEASREFVENISGRLDELLQAAGGEKKSLDVLERLETQQEQIFDDLLFRAELYHRNKGRSNPVMDQIASELGNKAESKARQIAALNQMIDDNLRKSKATIQAAVATASQAAQDKAREVSDVLMAWGDDAGDPMGRNAVNEAILQRVRGNKNLLQIAKFLGRFREILTNLRKNSYAFGRGEKYSLELGNDLGRVITSELALLAAPETVPLFLRNYQRKKLKQYQRREAVCKGHGDIIVCLDESSSTIGEPAAWGKALAFALLEVAKINKRSFALVHFSGRGSVKVDLFKEGQFDFERVIESCETFLGGGTDYETPLTEALALIQNGYENADVVFITDGECALPDEFAARFAEAKAAHRFSVTGLLLDKGEPGFAFSLAPFCERVYRTSELMGDDIARDLLARRA